MLGYFIFYNNQIKNLVVDTRHIKPFYIGFIVRKCKNLFLLNLMIRKLTTIGNIVLY